MSLLNEMDRTFKAQKLLLALIKERPNLANNLEYEEVIQVQASRAVFLVRWKGQRAIAKLIWHENKQAAVVNQTEALKKMADQLVPPYFVSGVLHVAPKAGLYIMRYVTGETAAERLKGNDPDKINTVVGDAMRWLTAATGERFEAPIDKNYLHGRLENLIGQADNAAGTQHMKRLAKSTQFFIDNMPDTITRYNGHGDFWPSNLIMGKDTMDREKTTAIDLLPQKDIQMVADVARFIAFHGCYSKERAYFLGLPLKAARSVALHLGKKETYRNLPVFYGLQLAELSRQHLGVKQLKTWQNQVDALKALT